MHFVAVLDACVLYPAYLRDCLLRLAAANFFEPRWSEQILQEMSRNLKAKSVIDRPDRVDRTVGKMRQAFPEAMVKGHEVLIDAMTNHPKDKHVLAAAVHSGADVVVTNNLKDFPRSAAEPHDIEVLSADQFLCCQLDLYAVDEVIAVLDRWAAGLQNPPYTLEELLDARMRRVAPNFAAKTLERVGAI